MQNAILIRNLHDRAQLVLSQQHILFFIYGMLFERINLKK